MIFRKFEPRDMEQIISLFKGTVLKVNIRDYSPRQVKVWADRGNSLIERIDIFKEMYTIVAEDKGIITGYGNVTDKGYIDHLYVHKDYQNMGIATEICNLLETYAKSKGVKCFSVHASITAKGFFTRIGYRSVRKQQVPLDGIFLTNFVMEKLVN